MVSSVPALNAVALSVPAEPRAYVKKPSLRATRAGACVMLLRKPSLIVTGALAAALEVPVDPEDDEEEEDEQPASSRAAPITAALVTRRI